MWERIFEWVYCVHPDHGEPIIHRRDAEGFVCHRPHWSHVAVGERMEF